MMKIQGDFKMKLMELPDGNRRYDLSYKGSPIFSLNGDEVLDAGKVFMDSVDYEVTKQVKEKRSRK